MQSAQDGLIVAQEFDAEFGVVALCIFEIGCVELLLSVSNLFMLPICCVT